MLTPRLLPRVLLAGAFGALVLLVGPAFAAGTPTLTASPAAGPVGTQVTLTYTENGGQQPCSTDAITFYFEGKQIANATKDPQSCNAQTSYTIPLTTVCRSKPYTFSAKTYDGTQHEVNPKAMFTVTCLTPTLSPTPRPTHSPTPKPTPSATATPTPTKSATPTPTPSATATPTKSATPTPTPTATATPTRSAVPVPVRPTETAEPVGPPSGGRPGGSTPTGWTLGAIGLGVLGVGGAGLLAVRGAGKPVIAGVAAAGLAGAGGVFGFAPTTEPPVIVGTYVTVEADCAPGDIPIAGGFAAYASSPALLSFRPSGSAFEARPEAYVDGDGNSIPGGTGSTVCLRTGRAVSHAVREGNGPSSAPSARAVCQLGESVLGGGFHFPWGIGGLSSHPVTPSGWAAAETLAGPADQPTTGQADAMCAALPTGVRVYVVAGNPSSSGEASASCYPGDAVLNGGWSGAAVTGSHPVDDGWQARFASGTGSAYAVCFHPSGTLGLKGSYVVTAAGDADNDIDASCGDGVLLGGGWEAGGPFVGLHRFQPLPSNAWEVVVPKGGGVGTSYALCGRLSRKA